MNITIEHKGLQTFLFTLLSCRCPVSEDTENRLFELYFAFHDRKRTNFNLLLKASENNPGKTPLHNLFDFCSMGKDDPYEFTITHNDVIRFSCTGYHYNRIKNSINPELVTDSASYLLSHVTVPAVLEKRGEDIHALYMVNDREISFSNLVLPPELKFKEGMFYGVHMGTAITELTMDQVLMIERHLSLIDEYPELTRKVTTVDFSWFQNFGDYRAQVIERMNRHL